MELNHKRLGIVVSAIQNAQAQDERIRVIEARIWAQIQMRPEGLAKVAKAAA